MLTYAVCCAVGYGDLVPTSWLGRMMSCIVSLSGIVVLALPIGIIGGNFAELYDDYVRLKNMRKGVTLETMDGEAMSAMFNHIDTDQSGTIDIFELKASFEEHGIKFDAQKLLFYFSEADRTGGGKLSLSEFVHMCQLLQVGGWVSKFGGLQAIEYAQRTHTRTSAFSPYTWLLNSICKCAKFLSSYLSQNPGPSQAP